MKVYLTRPDVEILLQAVDDILDGEVYWSGEEERARIAEARKKLQHARSMADKHAKMGWERK